MHDMLNIYLLNTSCVLYRHGENSLLLGLKTVYLYDVKLVELQNLKYSLL